MKEMEIVDEFSMKINNMVSNIRALGENIEEAYVVKSYYEKCHQCSCKLHQPLSNSHTLIR